MPSKSANRRKEARRKINAKIKEDNQRLEAELEKTSAACKRGYSKVFNINLTLKAKLQIVLFIAAVMLLFVWGVVSYDQRGFIYELVKFLGDKKRIEQTIGESGIFGPLIFIALQIIQTVISPIPGNVVGFAGGYLFGWWGILLTEIGCILGYLIVLKLTKRFGRAFVERLVSPDLLKKFDYLIAESGTWVLFLIFLIPALPDDVVIYIAGLTKIPISTTLFLATVGRFPSVVITNQLANSISNQNLIEAIVLAITSLAVVGVCIWKREIILNLVGPNHKKYWQELRHKGKAKIQRLFSQKQKKDTSEKKK